MSVKTTEVFPDLHHKMSKKIAQLTKVIYHLNTRNEDHQADLEIIQNNHQIEIQQILKDAANRLNSFKDAVELKQSELNQESKLKALQVKHEKEREVAVIEFNKFREKSSEREIKITNEFQKKYDTLQENVELMNKKFMDKLKEFESSTASLNKALKAAQSEGSSSMLEAKARFEKELADLVKTSNEKYQKMLVEQMSIQENLREEMNKRILLTKQEVTEFMKNENDKSLGQLRAQLNGDKQQELMTQKRQYEEQIQKIKEELSEKLERLLEDLKRQKEMYVTQLRDKDDIEKALRQQLEAIQSGFSSTSNILEEQITSLKLNLRNEQEKSSNLIQQVEMKSNALSEEQQVSLSLNNEVISLKDNISELENELKRIREELQRRGTLGAEAEAQLQKQLANSDKEANLLRKEIVKLTSTISELNNDMAKRESISQELASKNNAKIKSLQDEIASLNQQLKDTLKIASSDSDKIMKELNDLRKQLASMEASHKKTLEERNIQHQGAVSDLMKTHKDELAASQKRLVEIEKISADKEKQLLESKKQLENQHVTSMKELQIKHERDMKNQQDEHTEEINKLNSKISTLESQLSELSSKADGERGSLKGEMTRLEAKTKALQRDLETKTKEVERVESVCNGLKTQVESLREELKATQKAFRDKMDLSLAKLDGEWSEKVEKIKSEHAAALAKLTHEKDTYLREQLQVLSDQHLTVMESLKKLLQKEANESGEQLMKLENEKLHLVQELETERKEHVATKLGAAERLEKTIKDAEARRVREISELEKRLTMDSDENMNTLLKKHATELQQLIDKNSKALQSSIDQYEADKKQNHLEAQKQLKNALLDLQTKCNEEKKIALSVMENDFTSRINKLNEVHKSESDRKKTEIEELQKQLQYSRDEGSDLQRQLKDLHNEKARREEQFIIERDSILRDHQQDIRAEREKGERLSIEVTQKAAKELQATKHEFRQILSQKDEKVKELEADLQEMHIRYKNRESREEDLRIIEDLERQMVDKDKLVQQTKDEMMYFKREMLNREESYNTKFNANPNVGVMNVLKTKDKSAPGGPGKKPITTTTTSSAKQSTAQLNGIGSVPSMGVLGSKK